MKDMIKITKGNLPTEQQTKSDARIVQIQQRFSEHPSSGLTPFQAAVILREAEQGNIMAQCMLAEDMEEKDTHILSELAKRRRAVQRLNFNIVPPLNPTKDEKRDTEMLSELLDSFTWFDDFVFDGTDAILKGFSCQEFSGWESIDNLLVPAGVEWIDPSTFQVNPNNRNELRLSDGSYEGVELQPFNWVKHVSRSKSGYLARTGLVRTLIWPYIFKNYSIRDLAEFLEIYGIPIRLGRYSSGATEDEKKTLLKAVMSIGHNAGGIIPNGMAIDFQSAANGTSDPFLAMNDLMERAQSKAILGGTLTSQADGATSTNALGNVHNDVRVEVCHSDAKQLSATITRDLILPLYCLNGISFSNPRRHPKFEFDITQAEDITAFASALPALVNVGMKISRAWAHDKLQIPEAQDGEEILKPESTPAFLNAKHSTGFAALNASQDVDPLKAAPAAISGNDWQQTIDPVLRPIIDIIMQNDLATAKNKIENLYSDLDSEQLEDMIARGAFVAQLWGQLNA